MTRLLIALTLAALPCWGQQYSLPTSDVSASQWAEGAGDADANWFDELDEGFGAGRGSGSGPDDATTYWRNTGTIGSVIRTGMSSLTDPSSSSNHIVRWRWAKHASAGRQIDMDGTFSGCGTSPNPPAETDVTNVYTTHTYTLSAGEADAVTYSGCEVACFGTEVGGGSPRDPVCSAFEFEVPSAGGGGDDTITIFIGSLLFFAWIKTLWGVTL